MTSDTSVRVEFFGLPQLLTGRRSIVVAARTLSEVAQALVRECPALGGPVIDPGSGWLNNGYLFVVDGRFTRDASHAVGPESTVLLVSAQAGGT